MNVPDDSAPITLTLTYGQAMSLMTMISAAGNAGVAASSLNHGNASVDFLAATVLLRAGMVDAIRAVNPDPDPDTAAYLARGDELCAIAHKLLAVSIES